jgi:AcrR family transcriptional regulator
MPSPETRERILVAALALFNARGSAFVSTNHIAEEAGVSPGNLYYHFRNKEEIIRALLERMIAEFDPLWQAPTTRLPTLTDLYAAIEQSFAIQWAYRFFYRELVALLRHDPELLARYRAIQTLRLRQQEEFARMFVAAGVLRYTMTPSEIADLVTVSWVISSSWLNYCETLETPVTASSFRAGAALIARLLQPYIVPPDAQESTEA